MANVSLYYDIKTAKVTLNFSHLGSHARHFLPVGLQQNQWDKKSRSVINHPQKKELNVYLQSTLVNAQSELLKLSTSTRLRALRATDIRDKVCEVVFNIEQKKETNNLFYEVFNEYASKREAEKTRNGYKYTMVHIQRYDKDWQTLTFEDITPAWLDGLNKSMAKTAKKQGARTSYFRCLRAVVNYAIANDYTEYNGFNKFKIQKGMPAQRNFSVEELRTIFNYKGTPLQNRAIDVLKLIFCLRGINFKDLAGLTEDNIHGNRLTYVRAKTGRHYDILLEEETKLLINKLKGRHKLIKIFDEVKSYECAFIYLSMALREIEGALGFKHITTYYMRHSWATIAFNDCGVPAEAISLGLGHTYGLPTTNIYINKSNILADKANRMVLDWVFYGKKEAWA